VLFESYGSLSLSIGIPSMSAELALSPLQIGIVAAASLVVTIVLGPAAGRMADRHGRVPMLIAAKILALASVLICAFAPTFTVLVGGRLIAGLAWAIDFAVIMAYLSEFLSSRHKGKISRWQGFWYVAATANALLVYVLLNFGIGPDIWRWSLGSGAVIAAILCVLQLRYLVESPRWLASRGRLGEAVESLNTVYAVPAVHEPASNHSQSPHTTASGSMAELFRDPYRRRTLLAMGTFFSNGIQYFGIAWYLPAIIAQVLGNSPSSGALGTAAFNAFGIVGGFAAASLALRLRIRRAMSWGFGGVSLLLVVFAFLVGSAPMPVVLGVLSLFILVHSALASAGGMSIAASAYPSRLRAVGVGFTSLAGSTGAAIGAFVFPFFMGTFGPAAAVLVLTVVPALATLLTLVIRFDPERSPDPDHVESNHGGLSDKDSVAAIASEK
jgi:MFS family permease